MNPSEEDIESCKLTQNSEHGSYQRTFTLADMNTILDDSSTDDDHEDILNWIKEKNLCLYSKEKDTGDSLIKILLEDVGDGHEVVEKVMDSYISTTCSNPTSNAHNIKMNFTGLTLETEIGEDERDSGLRSWFRCVRKKSGDSVLDDIMDIKLKYQGCPWDNSTYGKEKKEICLGKVESFGFDRKPSPRNECLCSSEGLRILRRTVGANAFCLNKYLSYKVS